MKLKEYLATAQGHGDIVAFTYSFNGDRDEDADIEDFSIGARTLRLEDLTFSNETEGDVVDGAFVFNDGDDTIEIEPLY